MNGHITLLGMAWDHPRARNPLNAISVEWSKTSGVAVEWDARPLKGFEDQPLEELAAAYDLVLIDHPFVGFAATSGLITAVDDWVDPAYLADQATHSVGPSYASYTWNGKQWALAIDAACQVSAVRDDLWTATRLGSLPTTWADVADLVGRCRGASHRVAIALNPNHVYCAFLSIGVCAAGNEFWRAGAHVDPAAGRDSLEFLRELAAKVHPTSQHDDPIAISNRMSRTDEIIYVPLMFGYSNYSRVGFELHPLHFANAPRGSSGRHGSVLGGVGLALSARSSHRSEAAALARRIAAPEAQCGIYASAGGQPGHASAWDSPTVNAQTGGFFRATRLTMEHAFMRPRVAGHRRFQQLAGELVHRFVWGRDTSVESCLAEYGCLVDTLLSDWGRDGIV
jgi:multiple sugar transport system substrate-binding protein